LNKLLILDKDGTLVHPKSGAKFVQHPTDQELLPGVAEAIARYAADGWTMAIASNQGGVAAGHKTLDDAIAEMRYCLGLLPQVKYALFCPDFDGFSCWEVSRDSSKEWTTGAKSYRKPNPGMIDFAAAQLYGNRLWRDELEVLFVGDRPEDEQAAQAAGVHFMRAHDWREGR
jgi:D-glycero-D-manno-heptose 1,7-bisphosphate phosphatase